MTYAACERLLHELALIVKENRTKKGLTQAQLADRAGVTLDVVSRIERKLEVQSGALLRVLDYLGLNISSNDSGMKLAQIRQILAK